LREARAALDAVLADAVETAPADAPAATVPTILTTDPTSAGGAAELFAAELTWQEYALVQRLHFLDHRNQIRRLRAGLAGPA
jgi:hypothetical protein